MSTEVSPYSHPIHERMSEDMRLPHLNPRTFARATVRNLVVEGQRFDATDYLPQQAEYNDLVRKAIISDDELYRGAYVWPLKQPEQEVAAAIDAGVSADDLTSGRRRLFLHYIARQDVTNIDHSVKWDMERINSLENKQLKRVNEAAKDIKFMLERRQHKLHSGVVSLGNDMLAQETSPYYALMSNDSRLGYELRLGKLLGFKLIIDEEGLSHTPVLKNRHGKVGLPSERTEILGLVKRRPSLHLVS